MSIFDLSRIQSEAKLQSLEFHATVDSTNSLAMQLIPGLVDHRPALILTEQQTAGRGRGAHQWFSDAGALTFSLVLDAAAIPAAQRSLVSIATGIAIRSTIQQTLDNCNQASGGVSKARHVSLKWPNDVLIDERKVCGVLTELNTSSDHVSIVIGVGMNVNNSLASLPAEIQSKATSIFDLCGQSLDLSDLLIRLVQAIQTSCDRLLVDRQGIIEELNQAHVLTGKQLQVDLGNQTVNGRCIAVDDDGALLLDTNGQIQKIVAGSIVHWE